MTDMTMKERIARAIYTALEADGGIYLGDEHERMVMVDGFVDFRALSEAVLDAMREPTPYVVGLTLEAANLWSLGEAEDEDICRAMIHAMQTEGQ